ncbi:hypothetical protein [Allobaculum sp. Allo2]|uniref:hypothetical protein n=1 Tax=Allobaculum sp. Allo2 TaxID=2853432 RepID=UPI001F608432|nr:hypothetical protein [Allobaculum sp. Allo2]UNT92596.1 hypothetical protein KWG61_10690 [Allobaculum sp. Allo2]
MARILQVPSNFFPFDFDGGYRFCPWMAVLETYPGDCSVYAPDKEKAGLYITESNITRNAGRGGLMALRPAFF